MIALEIVLIGIGVSIISVWARYSLTDQKALKEKQKKIKEFQRKYMEALKNEDKELLKKLEEEKEEINKIGMEVMRESFKPTIYTLAPFFVILGLMSMTYGKYGNVVTIPLINIGLGWIWVYILTTIIFTMIFDKIVWRVKYGAS